MKNKYPWRALIFPAASEIGLEIHRALRDCKEVELYGANQPGPSVAEFHFQRLYELPPITSSDCLEKLQQLIADNSIDAIFPAHDDVTVWLARNADKLSAEVITSPQETCEICRSKRRTYNALCDIVRTPTVWAGNEGGIPFPVFVKPDRGQGSQRARIIYNRADLDAALSNEPDLIVLEHLPGKEYTVDCFSQRGKGLLFASPRERMQTKTGIATLSRPADLPQAKIMAGKISAALPMHGAWFFQIKMDSSGNPCLMEAAPRIAGSMALSRALGPNLPLLSLYEAAGYQLDINLMPADIQIGRSLDTRFICSFPVDAIYMDFDDTLVLREKVNTRLISLVFQCHNKGIPIYLITRHKQNITETLNKYRTAGLFDKIIHIPDDNTPKAKYIKETNAVLIDDSFAERKQTADILGIRCFDTSSALCLLDERA